MLSHILNSRETINVWAFKKSIFDANLLSLTNMKKSILLALAFAGLGCYAQTVNVIEGTEFSNGVPESAGRSFSYEEIGYDTTSFYRLYRCPHGKGTSYAIQKLSVKDSKLVYYNEINIADDERPVNECIVNGKILVFTDKYDLSDKQKTLWMHEFNADNGKETGSGKKMGEMESGAGATHAHKYFIELSPDQSKMMIVSSFQRKRDEQDVSASIYDAKTLNKISTKQLIANYQDFPVISNGYLVNNDGSIAYWFYYRPDDKPAGNYGIATIAANDTKNNLSVLPNDKIMLYGWPQLTRAGNLLLVSAPFADILTKPELKDGKKKNVGTCAFFFDPNTNAFTAINADYFPADVLEKLTYADGRIRKLPGDKAYKNYTPAYSNGNTYIVTPLIGATSEGQEFERDIIVSKYNQAGKRQWVRVFPRPSTDLHHFNYAVKNDVFYLLYEDRTSCLNEFTLDNYDPTCENYAGFKVMPASLVAATVDASGKAQRKILGPLAEWQIAYSEKQYLNKSQDLLIWMSYVDPSAYGRFGNRKERLDILMVKQ